MVQRWRQLLRYGGELVPYRGQFHPDRGELVPYRKQFRRDGSELLSYCLELLPYEKQFARYEWPLARAGTRLRRESTPMRSRREQLTRRVWHSPRGRD